MELKHLQALLGIADTGSFSAAATTIGTVQSNVSAHIARHERELDVQLVDRASGRLTEEGEVVVSRARRVMNELSDMVADVTALRQEVVGTVRLGMIGITGRWLVPQLFDVLRVRHPPHPSQCRRGLERPTRTSTRLGSARSGRRHASVERR